MAIIDLVPGIEVSICVDDHPLVEYNDDEEVGAQHGEAIQHQATRTVSKYVESATDKEFGIRYNVTSAFNMDCPTIMFKVFIDGVNIRSQIVRAHRYKELAASGLPYAKTMKGVESKINGMVVVKLFKFTEIKTS
jgi:tRNA U54 and U55 pseudouridine synthase Pus10